ncbi:hypothetical protein DFH09DRAFT_1294920 [Mycena vulgaris]|nr:hypothetical protein DFH09DRAFT_1294920 [Mycena vulgaris]
MLLILFLVHFLSQRSSASPTPLLNSRAPEDPCENINSCRRLFDIVWGCLTTIFACTWVSVHPNVPPPDQNGRARLWRKLKMMLIAVIAPELMVGFAIRQFFAARRLSEEFAFSRTHGFFFAMGGFVSQIGHPITTLKQLKDPLLGPEYVSAIWKVNVGDIMDKSKGDALSKGVALAQGLWFTTQCLARVHQHLPITELEVATLAFAVLNVFTWLLWWGKPFDVQQTIVIGPAEMFAPYTPTRELHWLHRLGGALFGYYSASGYNPIVATSVPSFWSMEAAANAGNVPVAVAIECLVGAIFGGIHCAAWKADFPSTTERWMWRASSVLVTTLPVVLGALLILALILMETGDRHEKIMKGTSLVAIVVYIVARLVLIILPFTTLRALPLGAFTDVNWSV